MRYTFRFTRQAHKDIKKLSSKVREKLKAILRNKLAVDPYSGKALVGELKGYYSMRLTYQDRIVYTINDNELIITIIRAKTHYGD